MIIVAGVDAEAPSLAALRQAIFLAEGLDADLHVVHVAHIPGTLLALLSQVPADVEELEEAGRAAVWEQCDPHLAASTARITKVDLRGYPPDTLVDYARDSGADIIVVGSRGRGELAALLLGSTGHRVLHTAPCDVLIVKDGG